MNQIAITLISALGKTRRDQTANDLYSAKATPMIELGGTSLALVVGGDSTVTDGGPRGGWSSTTTTSA